MTTDLRAGTGHRPYDSLGEIHLFALFIAYSAEKYRDMTLRKPTPLTGLDMCSDSAYIYQRRRIRQIPGGMKWAKRSDARQMES